MLGSHIDTVRNAGRFDGALGVVTAIEVVKAAFKSGKRFPFAIEVIAFGDEEGVRFASTLGGARALAGTFDAKALDEVGEDGVSRREALAAFGCDPSRLSEEARSPDRALGYVEVHIEQGPVLEKEGLPLGIVTAIDGVTRGAVEVDGVAGHAGTVPMSMRNDALAAAAEMLLAVERAGAGALQSGGDGRQDGGARLGGQHHSRPRALYASTSAAPPIRSAPSAVADIKEAIAAIAQRRGVTARLLTSATKCRPPFATTRFRINWRRGRSLRGDAAPAAERRRPRRHGVRPDHSVRHAVRALPRRRQPQPGRIRLAAPISTSPRAFFPTFSTGSDPHDHASHQGRTVRIRSADWKRRWRRRPAPSS